MLSERGLDENTVEYKGRRDTGSQNVALDTVVTFLKSTLNTADN